MIGIREKCLNDILSTDKKASFYQRKLQVLYNFCATQLGDKIDELAQNIAVTLETVTTDEVKDSIVSGKISKAPLNCISGQLSPIYPFVTSNISVLNKTVNKLLGRE